MTDLDEKIRKVLKKIFYICRLDCTQYDNEEDRIIIKSKFEKLLKMGADINMPYAHFKGCLPLCEACRTGDNMVVNLLLKYGAQVNKCDKFKCSPLYISASQGHLDVVRTLISHKADINSKNLTGYSPLLSAVENNHIDIAVELINSGADVNIKRPNICGVEMTLLTSVLLTKGTNSLAQKLLDAGALPHKFTRPVSSLLLELDHHQSFVKKLIKNGFTFECCDWLEINESNPDPGIQEMVRFLKVLKGNPLTLENVCRIAIRSCLSLSYLKVHIKEKVEQLPIPQCLKEFLLLES